MPTLPREGPTSIDLVKPQLAIGLEDPRDDDRLIPVVDAVNEVVRGLPIVVDGPDVEDWAHRPRVTVGATLLAARVAKRTQNPGGVEAASVTAAGVLYAVRTDPEIAMMLGVGGYAPPTVG